MIVPVLFLLLALTTAATSLLTTELLDAKSAQDTKIQRAGELAVSLGELNLLKSLQTTIVSNMNADQVAATGIDSTYVQQTPLAQEPGTNLYYATYEQLNGETTAGGAATDTAQNPQTSSDRAGAALLRGRLGGDPRRAARLGAARPADTSGDHPHLLDPAVRDRRRRARRRHCRRHLGRAR